MLGELDDRARRTVPVVGHGVDERLDVTLEQGADTHRAGLQDGEDRGVGEPVGTELASRLAQGVDHRVCGRVVRFLDPVVGPGDHRIVDDRDGRIRPLPAGERRPASARASPMKSS